MSDRTSEQGRPPDERPGQRIAIIGGGVAGLTAAHLLRERHHVTLFERAQRLGGNAYTLDTRAGYAVDIGVAAFGQAGYPRFYGLLEQLGIKPRISPGSFLSVHNLDTAPEFYLTGNPGPDTASVRTFEHDVAGLTAIIEAEIPENY